MISTNPLHDRMLAARTIKRMLDLILSVLALFLLAPLFAVIALLIRIDSPGPVLFRQKRVGENGSVFTCFKFRTMFQNADQNVHRRAIQLWSAGLPLCDDPNAAFKLVNDNRVTGIGAFLRRTSFDELPQLLNVFRGEMSLVGPRPAIPYELDSYKDWHHERYSVKPGITGAWQVHGRGTMSLDEMVTLDVEYARVWTVWLDIKLIVLTVPMMLIQRGAR